MKPEIVDGFVVVGDEAWLPEEWDQIERLRAKRRIYDKKYRQKPQVKARKREQHRAWIAAHPGRQAEYNRNWRARRRGLDPGYRVVASLHSLRCTGPTKSTGCRCKKTLIYRRQEAA